MILTLPRQMLIAASLFVMPTFAGFDAVLAQNNLDQCPVSRTVKWHNCLGTFREDNGNTYVGEFKDDKYDGQGTYTFESGGKYVGEFRENNWHGQGTYTFANGDQYVGEFKENTYNGKGTYTFANGDRYVGEFRDGKCDGQFNVSYVNGDRFSGSYHSDRRVGIGTYTWYDGSKYVGQWKDGIPFGDGILTNESGSTITGAEYETTSAYDADGYMISPDRLTYSGGTIQQQEISQQRKEDEQPVINQLNQASPPRDDGLRGVSDESPQLQSYSTAGDTAQPKLQETDRPSAQLQGGEGWKIIIQAKLTYEADYKSFQNRCLMSALTRKCNREMNDLENRDSQLKSQFPILGQARCKITSFVFYDILCISEIGTLKIRNLDEKCSGEAHEFMSDGNKKSDVNKKMLLKNCNTEQLFVGDVIEVQGYAWGFEIDMGIGLEAWKTLAEGSEKLALLVGAGNAPSRRPLKITVVTED
jgi:hypothetical protein